MSPAPDGFPSVEASIELKGSRTWVYVVWAAWAVGLVVYSQTFAFTADEGFHLLAAQLVMHGKRPYLDFCFPQTPLNVYWNALWMRFFGDSWRTAHVVAALETIGAVILASRFVLTRLPERAWRLAGAVAATLLIGCNSNVADFGTLGQAYGMCLFTTVCAFYLAVAAVASRPTWRAALAGACAGTAACSSLLAAPMAPVLLVWIWWSNRAGNRWTKSAAFAVGATVPVAPIIRSFLRAPAVVWFNIAQYHLHYRVIYWPQPLGHDLDTLTSWFGDSQSLLLGLLALFGVIYIRTRSGWSPERRAEFFLCAWLAIGLTVELAVARPTFTRYFCLLAPFLGILAIPGLYAIGSRVLQPDRPFWPVLLISVLCVGSLIREICVYLDSDTWPKYEVVAQKLKSVTPPGQEIFTEECFYFLTKHPPPPRLEFQYSHKLDLPPARRAAFHIETDAEIKQQIAAGAFWSAATCDDDFVEDYNLDKSFQSQEKVRDCPVYWGGPPKDDSK